MSSLFEVSLLPTPLLSTRGFGQSEGEEGGGSSLLYTFNKNTLTNGGEVLHPETYNIGDLLLLFSGARAGGSITWSDYTNPLAEGRQAYGQCEGHVYYRTAADIVASETCTYSFSRAKGHVVVAVAGGELDSALDADGGGTTTTTHTAPDLTTLTDGCRIFRCIGSYGPIVYTGFPDGELVAQQDGAQATVIVWDSGIQESAGPTGVASFEGTATYWVGITLAVKPV